MTQTVNNAHHCNATKADKPISVDGLQFDYTFDLSDTESSALRLNTIACLLGTCNVSNIVMNFAYPVYLRTGGMRFLGNWANYTGKRDA
jgi:hypothetical protein